MEKSRDLQLLVCGALLITMLICSMAMAESSIIALGGGIERQAPDVPSTRAAAPCEIVHFFIEFEVTYMSFSGTRGVSTSSSTSVDSYSHLRLGLKSCTTYSNNIFSYK